MTKFFAGLICSLGLLGMNSPGVAADPPAKAAAVDQEVLMKAWMESAKPAKQHEALAKQAGDWAADCVAHMSGASEPVKIKGTAKRKMILGGRFLQEDFKGEFMGQPFEGVMTLGYDNNTKKYTAVWVDSRGTGTMVSQGSDTKPGVVECKGMMYCPIQKKEMPCRIVTKHVDADHEVFEMYGPGLDGKEILHLTINYSRKKSGGA